jgi:hypothetical protein
LYAVSPWRRKMRRWANGVTGTYLVQKGHGTRAGV